jgi:flavin-dependent dehydrogenase
LTVAYDVVVVGGGPAGLALAGVLARGGRRVAVVERSRYETTRVGETFGGEVFALLDQLGAADALREFLAAQVPFRAVRSAWGSDELVERASIVHPLGDGIHVERARFDAALAEWARAAGADVRVGQGACAIARACERFVVTPRHGEELDAELVVDASGRGAPASAALDERRWLAVDRQVALVAHMPRARGEPDGELLVEAVEDGWWYSAPQPDGGLVATLVTDADLVPAGPRETLASRFAACLARSRHTAARAADHAAAGEIREVRADSGCLLGAGGRGWLAAGDAAMAIDPLAGNGVARALRSALALAAEMKAPEGAPIGFADYLDRRAAFYRLESRWSDALFWARRRALDWQSAPLVLGPDRVLRATGERSPGGLAPAEALLPPRAITAILAHLASPQPAHVAMTRLRELAPLPDRRLLVGLQVLLDRGALTG